VYLQIEEEEAEDDDEEDLHTADLQIFYRKFERVPRKISRIFRISRSVLRHRFYMPILLFQT